MGARVAWAGSSAPTPALLGVHSEPGSTFSPGAGSDRTRDPQPRDNLEILRFHWASRADSAKTKAGMGLEVKGQPTLGSWALPSLQPTTESPQWVADHLTRHGGGLNPPPLSSHLSPHATHLGHSSSSPTCLGWGGTRTGGGSVGGAGLHPSPATRTKSSPHTQPWLTPRRPRSPAFLIPPTAESFALKGEKGIRVYGLSEDLAPQPPLLLAWGWEILDVKLAREQGRTQGSSPATRAYYRGFTGTRQGGRCQTWWQG